MNDLVRPASTGLITTSAVCEEPERNGIVDVVGPSASQAIFLARDATGPCLRGRLSRSDECWSIRVQYVLQYNSRPRPGSAREGEEYLS